MCDVTMGMAIMPISRHSALAPFFMISVSATLRFHMITAKKTLRAGIDPWPPPRLLVARLRQSVGDAPKGIPGPQPNISVPRDMAR